MSGLYPYFLSFFCQAEYSIRVVAVTLVQTCALPICGYIMDAYIHVLTLCLCVRIDAFFGGFFLRFDFLATTSRSRPHIKSFLSRSSIKIEHGTTCAITAVVLYW